MTQFICVYVKDTFQICLKIGWPPNVRFSKSLTWDAHTIHLNSKGRSMFTTQYESPDTSLFRPWDIIMDAEQKDAIAGSLCSDFFLVHP